MSLSKFKNGLMAFPNIGNDLDMFAEDNIWFVDGNDGSDGNTGKEPGEAKATLQAAVTAAGTTDGARFYVKPLDIASGETDPASYAETVLIPNTLANYHIIGVSSNRTQGGLPQFKKGSGSSAMITSRAPGGTIENIGINGNGSTGGGITLEDDGGATAATFGTTIQNCHFKNCRGSSSTAVATGGAINLGIDSSDNAPWQVRIIGNSFYKNVGDIVLIGSAVVPQDIVIEDNTFMGLATSVDCHIYLAAGSGVSAVVVNNNKFADVLPALTSGSVTRYVDLTGCTGVFSNNVVGGSYTTTGFGAAKAAAKIPTTVGIAHNYSDAGLITREA